MKSRQLARSQFPALRAVCAVALSCCAGRWIRWAAGDCLERTTI